MACKLQTEVYSRIVGYYRPIQQWNKGKEAEYFNRKVYSFDLSDAAATKPAEGEVEFLEHLEAS